MPIRGIPGYTAPNVTAPAPPVPVRSPYVRPLPPGPSQPPQYTPGVRAVPPGPWTQGMTVPRPSAPPPIRTRPLSYLPLDQARERAVREYAPAYQNEIRTIPIGVQPTPGWGGMYDWGGQIVLPPGGVNDFVLRHELGHRFDDLSGYTALRNGWGGGPIYGNNANLGPRDFALAAYKNRLDTGYAFPGMFGNERYDNGWGGLGEYYANLASTPWLIPPDMRRFYPQFAQSVYQQPQMYWEQDEGGYGHWAYSQTGDVVPSWVRTPPPPQGW